MKTLVYILSLAALLCMYQQPCAAQVPVISQVAQDQLKLQRLDSLYKVRDANTGKTGKVLKQAKAELKVAQQNYDEAKRAHKQATTAAKEAKRSYKMEVKAQKARKKAENQADKAKNAALISDQ